MKIKIIILCLFIVGLIFVSGCTDLEEENNTTNEIENSSVIGPYCGDKICDETRNENCNNCADCKCDEGSYCTLALGKYVCKNYKAAPKFGVWIGSQKGIPIQNINLKAGDIAKFYVWAENRGDFTIECVGKEFHDSALKSEFELSLDGIKVRGGTVRKSLEFLIKVPKTPGGLDAKYQISCNNVGEDRKLDQSASIVLNFY